MYSRTDSTGSPIINDILDSHSYTRVYDDMLGLVTCMHILLQCAGYFLLSKNLYQSKGLFTTVTTMSSLVKIIPQFLGKLCLVRSMNGIDF